MTDFPPANVPPLEDTKGVAETGKLLSTRERMEEHRKNPACTSCHRVIDPLGLALENFDVVGAWRIKDNGAAVDANGVLYDGTRMAGPADLRRALLAGHSGDPRPALGHGVVILDAVGSVTSVNDAAERWLAQIPECDWPSSSQLPVPLLAAAAAVGTGGAGHEPRTPSVRLRTVRGDWLSVHASLLHGSDDRSTVLVLEEPGPGDVASLILDSHGVTSSQARVVALVLRGYSTKQIVAQLAISQYTVQEHLRAVFDKLGVRSRQELAAVLLRPGH